MKIKFKQFKEKSFFIPLSKNGQWSDYKKFKADEWKNNILTVLKLTIQAENPNLNKDDVAKNAETQLNMFVQNIRQHLSPHTPCLALAFPPAKCWFIAFVVDAFLPFEDSSNNNIFIQKHYAEAEQTIEIAKHKGDPLQFAFNLVNEMEN